MAPMAFRVCVSAIIGKCFLIDMPRWDFTLTVSTYIFKKFMIFFAKRMRHSAQISNQKVTFKIHSDWLSLVDFELRICPLEWERIPQMNLQSTK